MVKEIVSVTRIVDLREKLDKIDAEIGAQVRKGFYSSRLTIEIAMWDKGAAIAGEFTPLNSPLSYRELARKTGRNHKSLKRWHNIYKQNQDKAAYMLLAKEKAKIWTDKVLQHITLELPHVSRNTGQSEWYTPPEYIEAARVIMGKIDVDPATTENANKQIKAKQFYTADNNGLAKTWKGNVWMNPPYVQPLVTEFCDKFAEKFEAGEITQGCVLINNCTETVFAQRLLAMCLAVCFPAGRVKFLDKANKPGAPLQGQMILYFGNKAEVFQKEFSQFGVCILCAGK